ncbi:DUF305 domain-containing protein [Larkinella humicola]|uniref:DUF305 domain-containing protein n=1 Tax=Larkinella humicola TaxID=2607654 RepID=A0A5N1J3F8_9BACT|nr:DUF305 domain-containing protein [Larkinella humicola]KAA9341109.1 DUF305 domain-containing protein [Larkinella humicola]
MEAHKQHTGQVQPTKSGHSTSSHESTNGPHYKKLAIMTGLSFASMYVLMYSMVDRFANVIPNVNQVYMAVLMTMPMVIIEVLLMSSMYMDKRRNTLIIAVSTLTLIGFFLLIRQQGFVGDREFAKSMIPHHAAAILMAKEAKLTDPELQKLQQDIITAQEKEIRQMKDKLAHLDR